MEPMTLSFKNDNKKKKPTINTLNKAVRLANLYCITRFLYEKMVTTDKTRTRKLKTIGIYIYALIISELQPGIKHIGHVSSVEIKV